MATIPASKPSATTGNNRLAHLQGEARNQFQRHQKATAEAVQAYLECGAALIEAKAGCGHGKWLPWLDGTGIPKRTAQRMMALYESGLKSDTVTHLGGISGALDYCGWIEAYNRYERGFWDFMGLGDEAFAERMHKDHSPTSYLEAVTKETGALPAMPIEWIRGFHRKHFEEFDSDWFMKCDNRGRNERMKEGLSFTTMRLFDAKRLVTEEVTVVGSGWARGWTGFCAHYLVGRWLKCVDGEMTWRETEHADIALFMSLNANAESECAGLRNAAAEHGGADT